jgi:hypothetical protein
MLVLVSYAEVNTERFVGLTWSVSSQLLPSFTLHSLGNDCRIIHGSVLELDGRGVQAQAGSTRCRFGLNLTLPELYGLPTAASGVHAQVRSCVIFGR